MDSTSNEKVHIQKIMESLLFLTFKEYGPTEKNTEQLLNLRAIEICKLP